MKERIKEVLWREMNDLPEPMLEEVLNFVLFLKARSKQEVIETLSWSETALGKDWLRPEEDEAWRDL